MLWRTNKKISVLILALLLYSCKHKKELGTTSADKKSEHNLEAAHFREALGISSKEMKESKLYKFVYDWHGVPYKYGGCQKTGVDCSCFADNLYAAVYGKRTARSASDIFKACDKIKLEEIQEGDLLFFKINGSSISHVGIYLRNNKFVHSSTSKGVIISDLNEAYYKKYFYTAGRLRNTS
jgi:murein DD-endopeptidase / murein LD-carboxypeptidase